MKNKSFDTIEDLIASESFIAWYHRTDPEDIRIWNKWISASPKNLQLAAEAIRFLKTIRIREVIIPHEQVNAAVENIIRRIHDEQQ
jgi:hypothetical protein